MKKKLVVFAIIFLMSYQLMAQNINGQWRGFFNSNGDIVLTGGGNTEYVLEIDIKGTKVSGYSYSYFDDRRYYVICSLTGTYDKKTQKLRVTEVEKVKSSTPPGWVDCLQTHILTYQKMDGVEEMKGSWRSAPGGDCGSGVTTLTRKTLSKNLASFNKQKVAGIVSAPVQVKKALNLSDKNKPIATPKSLPVAKITPLLKPKIVVSKPKTVISKFVPAIIKDSITTSSPIAITPPVIVKPVGPKQLQPTPVISNPNFENRGSDVLKTIEIKGEEFTVALYDNGAVDGDSISLFYNGKLILSHQMLSEKAITLTLDATTEYAVNELTMYADNLGTIPPNTALMVVTDGDERYEVRISSDLKKSGTIRFVHKDKKQ